MLGKLLCSMRSGEDICDGVNARGRDPVDPRRWYGGWAAKLVDMMRLGLSSRFVRRGCPAAKSDVRHVMTSLRAPFLAGTVARKEPECRFSSFGGFLSSCQ
jgi:hypothetical protein